MSAWDIAWLVAALLALLAVILVPLGLLLRSRGRRVAAEVAAVLTTEPALRGPEEALYRGGSRGYPNVKGNGTIVLTERRLLFGILIGTGVDIPVAEITGLREAKSFQRSTVGGHVHLIVQTGAGEAGFFVEDTAAWIAAITSAAPALR
jgi:hypothetical protein